MKLNFSNIWPPVVIVLCVWGICSTVSTSASKALNHVETYRQRELYLMEQAKIRTLTPEEFQSLSSSGREYVLKYVPQR